MVYQRCKDQSGEQSLLPCLLHVILTGKRLHIIVADITKNPLANTAFFICLLDTYIPTKLATHQRWRSKRSLNL